MSSSRNLFRIKYFREPLRFAPSPFRSLFRILEGCLEQVGRSWDICRPVFRHRSAEQRRVGGEKEGNRFVGSRFSRNTCRLALPARGLTSSSFPRKRAFLFFFFSKASKEDPIWSFSALVGRVPVLAGLPPLYFLRALNAAFPVHRPPRVIASRGITAPR